MKGILREKWNSESGSAQIIEMTLIFPIVLFVLGFLIYVGSYVLQSTAMYTEAQKIAVIAAREGQMPGYENFFAGTGITTKTDFDWSDGYMPGKDIINEVMKVHDPYRYWGKGFLKSENKTTMEKALRQLIAENSFLAGTNVDCTISASADPLAPAIKVNVVKHLSAPGFLLQLGLTSSLDISVTAVAVVNDTSEFIRNTDMVYDLGTYLWENLKFGDSNQTMSQRVAIFKQKFTDARAKWGL